MISGMLVYPQLRKEAIFLINSNKKKMRASTSTYRVRGIFLSFPCNLSVLISFDALDRLESGRAMFVTGGETNGS
jgi:hypothetical protein